jgi:hypothetical protein
MHQSVTHASFCTKRRLTSCYTYIEPLPATCQGVNDVNENIEYIFAGGPQHGQIVRCLRSDEDRQKAPSERAAAGGGLPFIGAYYRHVDGDALRIAATRTRSNGDIERYVVLHAQATGEQFLTILAA